MTLTERDQQFVWHPFTQHLNAETPIEIVKAEGCTLYDSANKTYIDANSSWWVNVHGHGHPHIHAALSNQFQKLDHTVFAGVTHEKSVELAERICSKLPSNFQKVFFSDNGSTAVEVAMKMAFQYAYNKGEQKHRVLALSGAYHGDTFGAMSVGQRGYFNTPFEALFFDVDYLDFPTKENETRLIIEAESHFQSGEFAAVIVEPLVQGASGMRMYSSSFLDKLIQVAHANNVLVIFDEVMTGFGRTGKLFSVDHCSEKPDFMCMSKGLTAGVMALGLTVTTNAVFDEFLSNESGKAFLHGHSFTANPLACAVGCANLDLFEKDETWKGVTSIEEWGKEFLNKIEHHPAIETTRQCGTIIAFELKTGEGNTYFSKVRSQAYQHFLDQGVLLRPLGNVLFINPPYTITKDEYKTITDAVLLLLDKLIEK